VSELLAAGAQIESRDTVNQNLRIVIKVTTISY
jgi:hypothetical protein